MGWAGVEQHVKVSEEPRHWAAIHVAKILGEVEEGAKSKFAEEGVKHAAPIGHDDVACDEFGEKGPLQAGRARMNPAHSVRHQEHFADQRKRTGPIENDLGAASGAFEGARRVSNYHIGGFAQLVEHRELRLARIGPNEERDT